MNTETNRPTDEADSLSRPVSERDHARGSATAPVTLLMYGAYECPHCVEANNIVKEIESRLGERLRFVFRHFPRTNVHPHAEAAAEVAEAAGDQGKFWEMHDALFAHFNHLDGEHLMLYARELELDMERFEQAINHRSFAARVLEDFKSGEECGVRATPTFFINGMRHRGAWDIDALLKAVDTGD
jgi:protein-disulfide isomerase